MRSSIRNQRHSVDLLVAYEHCPDMMFSFSPCTLLSGKPSSTQSVPHSAVRIPDLGAAASNLGVYMNGTVCAYKEHELVKTPTRELSASTSILFSRGTIKNGFPAGRMGNASRREREWSYSTSDERPLKGTKPDRSNQGERCRRSYFTPSAGCLWRSVSRKKFGPRRDNWSAISAIRWGLHEVRHGDHPAPLPRQKWDNCQNLCWRLLL